MWLLSETRGSYWTCNRGLEQDVPRWLLPVQILSLSLGWETVLQQSGNPTLCRLLPGEFNTVLVHAHISFPSTVAWKFNLHTPQPSFQATVSWIEIFDTDWQHSPAFLHYAFLILLGQSGTLLGLWRGYYRSGGPCTGASIPCFLFYLCDMQTANWRASICSGGSWRSLLPWGLLQVNMEFKMSIKNNSLVPNVCFLPSNKLTKEVRSEMQCLQPSNHSKRRRYWQLHCRMPGTLLPRELLQMRGRQWMNKRCPIQTHWQHRRTLNRPALCVSCRFASFNSLLNQMNMAAILWMGECFARPVTWTWSLASTNMKTKDQAEKHYFF